MERLTIRTASGAANIVYSGCLFPDGKEDYIAKSARRQLAIDRLAAYEDTGLNPEKIEHILDEYGRGLTLRASVGERLEIVREIPIDRLRELAEADRDGRCVVLPCKIGDIVWCIYTGAQGNHPTVLANRFEYGMIPYWGISVFPDKKQAEAALKERENNG